MTHNWRDQDEQDYDYLPRPTGKPAVKVARKKKPKKAKVKKTVQRKR